MKKILLIITLCLFAKSFAQIKNDDALHSVKSESLVHSISTLENIKILSPTPEERRAIDSLKSEAVVSLEKCQKISRNCIDDIELFGPGNAGFKGGINNFRKILFEKFKIHANTQKGENRLRITIGKQNNIEKIDFLRYTDDVSKKEIVSLFQSKELNNWHSAKVYKYPVKQEFEISIFIENKR
ncbi:hypothetical protein [Chryseobacterium sp. MEBOG07]|uniref:hypothetical protein n=1 Tax=Chryseobacterium sp. MEBOG07 TaxID=2879939 RepID=UPI001F3770C7|nr:hypothetical protein [Chryseobacterium sp. MEBOG07]UKB78961.1 hypothetical protein LF886_21380 [Chryseobacterium sp. MEBOG07]